MRGQKTRALYSVLVKQHRAAIVIQCHIKSHITRREFLNTRKASIIIQSGKYVKYQFAVLGCRFRWAMVINNLIDFSGVRGELVRNAGRAFTKVIDIVYLLNLKEIA